MKTEIKNEFKIGSDSTDNGKINVLYIYDKYEWAIYKVGKLWLENNSVIEPTYKIYSELHEKNFAECDIVWFGYLELALMMKKTYDFKKCIISIHDPLEFFPQVKNWKSKLSFFSKEGVIYLWKKNKKIKMLKKVALVVTASLEMKKILAEHGITARYIPTMGDVPVIDPEKIKTEKCSALSIFHEYPRKNTELLNELKEYCRKNIGINLAFKKNGEILLKNNYIKLLDSHEIYICTSFQEGGPIPAMEAMARGAVVITTPVGQMPEIITSGESGFICKTKKEFIEALNLLSEDLNLLHKMRLKSREAILRKRNEQKIKNDVSNLLKNYVLKHKKRASYIG